MTLCWLCDQQINDPPRIIGRILAGETRVAHLDCWRLLGELDLDLRRGDTGPELDGRQAPGRP